MAEIDEGGGRGEGAGCGTEIVGRRGAADGDIGGD